MTCLYTENDHQIQKKGVFRVLPTDRFLIPPSTRERLPSTYGSICCLQFLPQSESEESRYRDYRYLGQYHGGGKEGVRTSYQSLGRIETWILSEFGDHCLRPDESQRPGLRIFDSAHFAVLLLSGGETSNNVVGRESYPKPHNRSGEPHVQKISMRASTGSVHTDCTPKRAAIAAAL